MSTTFSNLTPNESISPPEDWIDEDILANLEDEDDRAFQAWLAEDDETDETINEPTENEGIWVPLSRRDFEQAKRLGDLHPDPNCAEQIRQQTLAALALERYLDSHGIAVEGSTNPAIVQLLNPTAAVVLPNLGRLEALVIQPEDVQGNVEFTVEPGTLAYVLMELENRGAELHGVMLSDDLRQDWPEGGTVPVSMAKPMSALWEGYCRWQKCEQVTAAVSEAQNWSETLKAEVITMLNQVFSHVEEHDRPGEIKRFFTERHEDLAALSSFSLQGVREETPDPTTTISEETVDWLGMAMDWLDELVEYFDSKD